MNLELQVKRRQKQRKACVVKHSNVMEMKRIKPTVEIENKLHVKRAEDADFEEVREPSYGHN